MTVILNKHYEKLDLKKIIIDKISSLINFYISKFELSSIYFNHPIDDITHYQVFLHFSNGRRPTADWYSIKGTTLVKILICLQNLDFHGMCKLTNGNIVKIKPKNNNDA